MVDLACMHMCCISPVGCFCLAQDFRCIVVGEAAAVLYRSCTGTRLELDLDRASSAFCLGAGRSVHHDVSACSQQRRRGVGRASTIFRGGVQVPRLPRRRKPPKPPGPSRGIGEESTYSVGIPVDCACWYGITVFWHTPYM